MDANKERVMRKAKRIILLMLGFVLPFAIYSPSFAKDPEPALVLKDQDTVVWLGATFVERMQQFGNVESAIVGQFPKPNVRFRNLGWSGDAVTGISRAVFGNVEDGYKRLQKDLGIAKPTVVIVQYGAVEAENGESGEAEFGRQLDRLLDTLTATESRLVLLSPLHRTRPQPFFPDPEPYNKSLDRYCDILAKAAASRGIPYVDIRDLLEGVESADGIVPTAVGYQQLAPALVDRLVGPPQAWSVALQHDSKSAEAAAVIVSDIQWLPNGVEFQAIDSQLPARGRVPAGTLTINGLKPGRYIVRASKRELGSYTHEQLAKGVSLESRGGMRQAEQLRERVVAKNSLFFHRHRPQNETYLFLFRKHEQGNNAVEVEQFDPLISRTEARVNELRHPSAQLYEITRQP